MKIVIPIAGRGSKFVAAGHKEPKPLIEVKGKLMIRWATDALPLLVFDENVIFLINEEQEKNFHLSDKLRDLYGSGPRIIPVGATEGAAATVLAAKDLINGPEELIIYNGDQYFKGDVAKAIADKMADTRGIIPVFRATNQKWSFVELGEDGYVKRVAEKEPISNLATVGLYYFAHGRDFVWAAERMIAQNLRVSGEFYICPVYNELIARGDKIVVYTIKEMWSLGTPEDAEYFKKYYRG
jgi:dTDP-glucose pyrophosphorylase